jgi:hypothetical protein
MSEIPAVLTPALGSVVGEARQLGDDALIEALRVAEERVRSAQAERAALIAVVAERIAGLGHRVDATADQIAVVLEISPRSADNVLGDSLAVVSRPRVWTAVFDGLIDLRKALLIVQGLDGFGGLPRAELEADAIAFAQSHTAHELRLYLMKLTCDGDPGEIFRKEALAKRGVSIFPAGHGMADVAARLSIEHAEILFQRLTALAKRDDCPDPYSQGDERTLDQRRADALVGFLDNTTQVTVHVDVTISADALIGDDHRDALLGRHGAIPASLARYLAWSPDARWRRLVTDPLTGALIDANAEVYKIPDRIKRAVRLRDRVPAGSPAAPAAPNTPTPTTSTPGPNTAKPKPRISPRCADATTWSRPTPPGPYAPTAPAPASTCTGPAHWAPNGVPKPTRTTEETETFIANSSQ